MKRNVIETMMGGLVLLVAAGFLFFAYKSGNVQSATGYTITAKFDRVDGLVVGADIRVSGIKVGAVTAQNIDPQTYQAIVSMTIRDDVKVPNDSSAEIVGDGLLGGKYIAIVPGGSSDIPARPAASSGCPADAAAPGPAGGADACGWPRPPPASPDRGRCRPAAATW